MPIRRGHLAPQNTFIETVIRKFDGFPGRNFVIGNALSEGNPIIYCNSSFCELTGYERHELVQRDCSCNFLYGPETDERAQRKLQDALRDNEEHHIETYYYRKDGEKFLCSVIVAPIKNEQGYVIMYIVNHEEIRQDDNVFNGEEERSLPKRKISTMLRNSIRRKKSVAKKNSDSNFNRFAKEENDESISLTDISKPNNNCKHPTKSPTPPRNSADTPEIFISVTNHTPSESPSDSQILRNGDIRRDFSSSLTDLRSSPEEFDRLLLPDSQNMRLCSSEGNVATMKTELSANPCLERSCSQSRIIGAKPPLVSAGTTQKVAQVMSLGSDVLPEYKVESPKIHPWTILHYSPFKAIWDWVVLFLVMYTAIITPYMAAFVLTRDTKREALNENPETRVNHGPISIADDPLVIVDYIVDVMFIIDIFINFRTTFVDSNDEVVSDPCRVAVNYMKGWFVVDLLAAIPFELLIMIGNTDQTTTLIGLLKTARLLRLVRVARKLDRYSEYGTALLLLLMFGFALVAHWLACMWYAIGNFERPGENSLGWLTQLGDATHMPYNDSIPDSGPDLQTKYLTALYFTLSSLTSVGFGNVSANTNGEKVFTILIMFLGALMHAVIFGNVTAIIQRLYSGMAHYHATMRKVREFIRFYQIPSPLRQRLEDYSQYDYSYTNGIDMNEVLRNFPEGLQADICLHLNRHLLSSNPAFRGTSPGCLRSLSLKILTTHCPPGDYIIHTGDEISNLYWIGRGTVEIILNETIIAILGKGDSFGENFGFTAVRMTGKARASVRALTYCDLHSISRDNLLYIMRAYPEFRKTFNEEMQITFDLRDLELEERDMNTSMPNVAEHQSVSAEHISTSRSSFREQRSNSQRKKGILDSVNECNTPTTPNVRRNPSNTPPSCNCEELKKDIDDMRQQLHRLESSMKDDIKLILGILRTKQNNNYNPPSLQVNVDTKV